MTFTLILLNTDWSLSREGASSPLLQQAPASREQKLMSEPHCCAWHKSSLRWHSIPNKPRNVHNLPNKCLKKLLYMRTAFQFNVNCAIKMVCASRRGGFNRHSSKFLKQKTTHFKHSEIEANNYWKKQNQTSSLLLEPELRCYLAQKTLIL